MYRIHWGKCKRIIEMQIENWLNWRQCERAEDELSGPFGINGSTCAYRDVLNAGMQHRMLNTLRRNIFFSSLSLFFLFFCSCVRRASLPNCRLELIYNFVFIDIEYLTDTEVHAYVPTRIRMHVEVYVYLRVLIGLWRRLCVYFNNKRKMCACVCMFVRVCLNVCARVHLVCMCACMDIHALAYDKDKQKWKLN